MDTRSFREAVRTVTVSYPVPFILAASLAFALTCLAGAVISSGGLRWLLAGVGTLAALNAMFLASYAVLWKPDLLRSERHSLLNRYLDVLEDSDTSKSTRDRFGRVIIGYAEEHVSKGQAVDRDQKGPGSKGEDGNV
jgi:hypothetical protein